MIWKTILSMVVVVFFCYNFPITCYHQLLVFAFNCEKYRCMGYFVSVFDVGYDKAVSLLFQGGETTVYCCRNYSFIVGKQKFLEKTNRWLRLCFLPDNSSFMSPLQGILSLFSRILMPWCFMLGGWYGLCINFCLF